MGEKEIKKEMLKKVYFSQEEKIEEIIKKSKNEIKEELNEINLEKFLEKNNYNNELRELIEKIDENNGIRISFLSEKIYEQGFIDAINLMIECLN